MTDPADLSPQPKLESWKTIAAYLNRDARTVRRWERAEGLPVHRHRHLARSSVYAYPSELDVWLRNRTTRPGAASPQTSRAWRRHLVLAAVVAAALASAGGGRVDGLVLPEGQTAEAASRMPKLLCQQCGDPNASISADGRFMATEITVASPDYPSRDIGIRDLRTGTLLPLRVVEPRPGQPGSAGWPIFSPDDSQIAYALLKGRTGTELHVRPRAARAASRVLVQFPPFHVVHPLAWSGSGSILIRLHLPDTTDTLATVAVADGRLTTLISLGPRMSAPRMASLSPDARHVAYAAAAVDQTAPPQAVSDSTVSQIYVLAVDGSSEIPVTTGVGAKRSPIWTADGKHLLYLSDVAGGWDLWAVPVRNGRPAGDPVVVRADMGTITPVGVSRSGVYYFVENRTGVRRTSVVTFSIAGRHAGERITDFVGEYPAWSPDGQSIAVTRPSSSDLNGRDIVVRDVMTGRERLYRHPRSAGAVHWFPNGKALLLLAGDPSAASSTRSWRRFELQTSESRQVAPFREDRRAWALAGSQTLSADGLTVYVAGYAYPSMDPDRIFAFDLTTGRWRQVYQLSFSESTQPQAGGHRVALATSPDGRSLAIAYIDFGSARVRLARVNIDGTDYRELAQVPRPESVSHQLLWKGDWIYVSSRLDDRLGVKQRIVRLAADGGPIEDTGVEISDLSAFDVSPDGTRLAFSTSRQEAASRLLWSLDPGTVLRASR